MNHKKAYLICCFIVALFAHNSFSQISISSPYSRYGIGDLQSNQSIRNISMGGISYGFRDSSMVNYANPASYTAFDTLSFVFETGVSTQFDQLQTIGTKQYANYTSLANLVFGFHITRWWGASIGVLPFSSMGYNITDYQTQQNSGEIKTQYQGSGGLNQFYFGNAFKLSKSFSVGLNTSYIYGTLNNIRTVSYPNDINALDVQLVNSTQVHDFMFNYGLQYEKRFKIRNNKKAITNKYKFAIGFVYNASTHLAAKQDSFAYGFFTTTTGAQIIKDTNVNSSNTKGKIILPQAFGGGITLRKEEIPGKTDSWLIGFDYHTQNWANFSDFGVKDSLKNCMSASIGMEYTPKSGTMANYFRRIHYRIGARYDKTYLELHNSQLSEYAVGFGLGLPLRRSKTSVNLGVELGQRGTINNELVKEDFIQVVLSLSDYEFWFIKHHFE
ncbi:MAG: hypothetical protein ABR968_00545 [Bacteroidales bacterium]|jgi:hypothetical protein